MAVKKIKFDVSQDWEVDDFTPATLNLCIQGPFKTKDEAIKACVHAKGYNSVYKYRRSIVISLHIFKRGFRFQFKGKYRGV